MRYPAATSSNPAVSPARPSEKITTPAGGPSAKWPCVDGCSYQEIADQLRITVNHAGVLLHRARAGLRYRLRAFDPANQGEPAPGGQA